MATRTRNKSRRAGYTTTGQVRPFDVRQHLSRQLHAPAVNSLVQLLQQQSADSHDHGLIEEVLASCASALGKLKFKPQDPQAFLASVHLAAGCVPPDSPLAASVQQTVARIESYVSTDPVATDDPLFNSLVDGCIRSPEFSDRLPEEIADEAATVRDALRLIEAGADDAAAKAVAGIGFRSPLAPWRMLIRGMVAYYGGTIDQAIEAWQRLPADRVPRGIAQAILATQNRRLGDDPIPDKRRLGSLVDHKQPNEREIVDKLSNSFNNDELDSVAEQLSSMSQWKSVDQNWLSAVRDRLYAELLICADVPLVRRVCRMMKPPRWDLKCDLPVAIAKMLSIKDPVHGDVSSDIDKYLATLEKNTELSDVERRAIRGAVLLRLAMLLRQPLELLYGKQGITPEATVELDRVGKSFGHRLVVTIRECVSLWPNWDRPMGLLASGLDFAYFTTEIVIDIHEQRLAARGDEIKVLKPAADFFYFAKRYDRAKQLSEKLLAIAPRDEAVRSLAWAVDLQQMREALIGGNVELAQQIIERMALLKPAKLHSGILLLLQALPLIASDKSQEAQQRVQAAIDCGLSPLAALMLMEIYIAKAKLPAKIKKIFADQRKLRMKSPSISDVMTTIELCSQAALDVNNDYPGRVGHLKDLITCSKRVLTSANRNNWTIELANILGEFVVRASDGTLRRRYLQLLRRHYDWHIVILVSAIEQGPYAARELYRVVHAESNDPYGLPTSLKALAASMFEETQSLGMFGYDDDDEFDDEDDDGFGWYEEDPTPGPKMEELDPEHLEILTLTMPADIMALFLTDPKQVEKKIRELMPPHVANIVIKALHQKSEGVDHDSIK